MSDEFDVQEYVESEDSTAEEIAATSGFGTLPEKTREELKRLRKEHAGSREAAAENVSLRRELLTAKYGEDVVELIPPEVTDYARQTELAEKFKERLVTSSNTEAQAGAEATEAVTEPPTEAEQTLATATGGPATGTTGAGDADAARERIIELAKQATI